MSELTQARLKELLHYDPDTGIFTWKVRRNQLAEKGSEAGNLNSDGYIRVKVSGKSYQAHRLAWLYMKGYFPKNIDIDHEDQIKYHNWWSNLRLASRQCNTRNCGNRKTNTSGVRGISWRESHKKWSARITVNGDRKYLGHYKDFDNAVCARLAGEQDLNWEGCDSNSPAYQYVKEHIQNAR